MKETFLNKYYKNEHSTFWFRMITSFTLGLIFSPFSNGIFFLIFLSLLSELFCYIFTSGSKYWNPIQKPFILFSYILGWILGRFLTVPRENILNHGIPKLDDFKILE